MKRRFLIFLFLGELVLNGPFVYPRRIRNWNDSALELLRPHLDSNALWIIQSKLRGLPETSRLQVVEKLIPIIQELKDANLNIEIIVPGIISGVMAFESSSVEEINQKIATASRYIKEFILFPGGQTPHNWWLNIFDEEHRFILRSFAEIASLEFKVPSYLLKINPHIQRRRIQALGNRSVHGLIKHLVESPSKLSEVELKTRFPFLTDQDIALGPYYLLRKILDILPKNLNEWIEFVREELVYNWAIVPLEFQSQIVKKAAGEVFKKPVYRLSRKDLTSVVIPFLNRTLSSLLIYHGNNLFDFRTNLNLYPALDDLDGWSDFITNEPKIFWSKGEVPDKIRYELIIKPLALAYGLEEVIDINYAHLEQGDKDVMNGRSFARLYNAYWNMDELRLKLIVPPRTREIWDETKGGVAHNPQNFEEWLTTFKYQGISKERWEDVSDDIILKFQKLLAASLHKPLSELKKIDYFTPIPQLGPEGSAGRALITLYRYLNGE